MSKDKKNHKKMDHTSSRMAKAPGRAAQAQRAEQGLQKDAAEAPAANTTQAHPVSPKFEPS